MKLITKEIEKKLSKYPLRSQDGKGKEAVVICKFFLGNFTWYVLEGNKLSNGDWELYGIVDNCGIREYGYFMLNELMKLRKWQVLKVERDMYFSPCNVGSL
jgi:hypothetical protein